MSRAGVQLRAAGDDIEAPDGAPVPVASRARRRGDVPCEPEHWFNVQPDLQYIINPGGIGRTPNAFVAGCRFNVAFDPTPGARVSGHGGGLERPATVANAEIVRHLFRGAEACGDRAR